MHQTPNQLYKKSGSKLPFKQWLEANKSIGKFMLNAEANEDMINSLNASGTEKAKMSVNTKVLIVVGIASVVGIGLYLYKNKE